MALGDFVTYVSKTMGCHYPKSSFGAHVSRQHISPDSQGQVYVANRVCLPFVHTWPPTSLACLVFGIGLSHLTSPSVLLAVFGNYVSVIPLGRYLKLVGRPFSPSIEALLEIWPLLASEL